MTEINRDFKGIWIPKQIYEAPGISWTAKILFVEIDSFTSHGRECFMSNEYLSEFLGISQTQVSKHISKLIDLGWIQQTRFDGRKRYLRSCLDINFNTALNKSSTLGGENNQGRSEENLNHTNTSNKPGINTNHRESSPYDLKSELIPKIKKDNLQVKASARSLEVAKVSSVANIKDRKDLFRQEMEKASEMKPNKYSKAFLNKFYRYYIRVNPDTGLMKFESDRYWDTAMQLITWWDNEKDPDVKSNKPTDNEGFVLGQRHNAYG